MESAASASSSTTSSSTPRKASSSFIKTVTLNYISRDAVIAPATHVEVKGRTVIHPHTRLTVAGAADHNDNDNDEKTSSVNKKISSFVRMGRYCHVLSGTTITTPPHPLQSLEDKQSTTAAATTATTPTTFIPVVIGSHTIIEQNCTIRAAAIGSFCWIGSNVKLMDRVIIKDACVIESGTIVPADTVIPPFTRVYNSNHDGQVPAKDEQQQQQQVLMDSCCSWTELPPATAQAVQEKSLQMFQDFVTTQQQQ